MSSSSERKVTFDPTVIGAETISIYDYTPREIAASWYDGKEMDRITSHCVRIQKKMEANGFKSGAKYCTRGLEGHTAFGSINKKKNRLAASAAVLDEQARQLNENEDIGVQAIADVYRRTTSSCQMWANVMGNRDQVAAEAFLCQDDDCNRYPTKSANLIHASSDHKNRRSTGSLLLSTAIVPMAA